MNNERFKVWRNPYHQNEPPKYMGEFSPPTGSASLSASDLVEFGLPVGTYTVLVPESVQEQYELPRWQRIEVR
jgi:hypothetical protein